MFHGLLLPELWIFWDEFYWTLLTWTQVSYISSLSVPYFGLFSNAFVNISCIQKFTYLDFLIPFMSYYLQFIFHLIIVQFYTVIIPFSTSIFIYIYLFLLSTQFIFGFLVLKVLLMHLVLSLHIVLNSVLELIPILFYFSLNPPNNFSSL